MLSRQSSPGESEREIVQPPPIQEIAFGYPRDFLTNKLVYFVISPRAGGLSIGINLHPTATCNLNCVYCEVDRNHSACATSFDSDCMALELREALELARGGWLRQWPRYKRLPAEMLEVRHVALSGDGEPTLSERFLEAMSALIHVRAAEGYFKIVLVTNSTGLDRPAVQEGIGLLDPTDEVWAKLDGGTQQYLSRINGSGASLERILKNILLTARRRPVVIQSLFPVIDGNGPSKADIAEYVMRLKELKEQGAQISLVQVYSATRPMARDSRTGHLPLKVLSQIARTVRGLAGLRAEVY